MPQRFLRPGLTTSERWNSVSFAAQSLYIRILTLVDDFGRYDARIPVLHGQCFALRNDIKPLRTAALRSELLRAKLIEVYEVDGREYLEITQWQERSRSQASKFPEKPQVVDISTSAAESCAPLRSAAESCLPRPSPSSLAIVPRPSSSTIATASETVDDSFARFWESYPKKAAKGDADKAWKNHKCTDIEPLILAAVAKCKGSADWTREQGRFIPHPATWLNRRGWEDELLPHRNGTSISENIIPRIE